ncbi:MAG: TrmH family RNA methyltransferase, partial [Cyanobacteria bacterium J06648_10]
RLKKVAIVFGSERSGLSNQDVDLCDIVTTIPQAVAQPSLNLAQAVMVYSFTLAEQQTQIQIKDQRLQSLLRPYEDDAMQAYPVSTTVNSPRNKTAACVEPLGKG